MNARADCSEAPPSSREIFQKQKQRAFNSAKFGIVAHQPLTAPHNKHTRLSKQKMKIIDLREVPHHIPVLANWHHEEWSYLNPGGSVEKRIEKMMAYLCDSPIPSMYVFADNNQIMGSAGILDNDMDTKPDLTPWLASVYVRSDFRNAGIGSMLVNHVVAKAREQGLAKLYLFTPNKETFYKKLGWQTLSIEQYRGERVAVMQIALKT